MLEIFIASVVCVAIVVVVYLIRENRNSRRWGREQSRDIKLVWDEDWDKLTERQKQVARRIALGQSYKQVAAALGITTDTVSAHLKRIYLKMKVSSRIELSMRLRDLDE